VRTGRDRRRPVPHVNVVRVPEKNPFSGTGTTTDSDGEEGVETAVDGSLVGSIAGNGAGDNNLATIEPIEPLEGGGAVLAELARAVERDLADAGPRASDRVGLRPHDWADCALFCGRHGLAPLPVRRESRPPNNYLRDRVVASDD